MHENVYDDYSLLFGIVPDWFVTQKIVKMWPNYNDNSVLNPCVFISWNGSKQRKGQRTDKKRQIVQR